MPSTVNEEQPRDELDVVLDPSRFETEATRIGRLILQWAEANVRFESSGAYIDSRPKWRMGVRFYRRLSQLAVKHQHDHTQAAFAVEALELFDRVASFIERENDRLWGE